MLNEMPGRAHKVIIMSGGIDSLVTAALFREQHPEDVGHGFFIDYGQRVVDQEEKAVMAFSEKYGIVTEKVTMDVPFFDELDLVREDLVLVSEGVKDGDPLPGGRGFIVPYRNMIILSMAASLASIVGASEVWCGFDYHIAASRTNGAAPDKSPGFVVAINTALHIAREGGGVRVITPIQGNSKRDTIREGERMGVDWSSSWSCYNNFDKPCGVCAQCIVRKSAFEELGVVEGVEYLSREQLGLT
jgi:7-cyano-7-deazaguanine synthase